MTRLDLTRPGAVPVGVASRSGDAGLGGGRVPRRGEIESDLVRDNREYIALRKVAELLGPVLAAGALVGRDRDLVRQAHKAALDVVLEEHRDFDALDIELDRAGDCQEEVDEGC